ncbi:Uu.00g080950.m01.CDS01 [Anthostomella pinea]|uniref:Uu.00g080950.m01.CDS01 n=1 Tax=Anthostomella pinea TaxID=933095 RepID=A0AAI8VL25_9PEZI|nr:Uu.00g080950.m01.CDS01 [Anthostomella pinea]
MCKLFLEVWKSVGADFQWSSECYNDDVPYWVDLPWEKGLPEAEKKGISVAETYVQYLKNTLDCLYREGGKMMSIPMHTRIIGKPGRSEALRQFMQFMAEKEGVWRDGTGQPA